MTAVSHIPSQAVGAYGEKVAEAELLRHGWLTANVNASVKNAADYDILAQKGARVVCLRVKTCGAGQRAFQFNLKPGQDIAWDDLKPDDFTILVSMGAERSGDEFWVLPTSVLRERLRASQVESRRYLRRDGLPYKDKGWWALWLDPLKSGKERAERDVATAWACYRGAWGSLDAAV